MLHGKTRLKLIKLVSIFVERKLENYDQLPTISKKDDAKKELAF